MLVILVLGLRLPQWQTAVSMNQLGLAVASTLGNPVDNWFVCQSFADDTASGSELAFLGIISATGNLPKAIAFLDRATQMPVVRPTWWVQLANLYIQVGQLDKTVQALSHLAHYEQMIFAGCKSAVIDSADTRKATYWCPLLPHLRQSSPESACLLGGYLAQVGQYSDAQLAFEQAARSLNVGDDCLYRYGLFQYSRQQYTEAAILFERAFSQKPLPLYLRAIGDLYTATQQPELAMQKYQQAQAMAPPHGRDCADALGGMGKVYYYYYGDYERASLSFYGAMRCDVPLDVSVYWVLMQSERAQGHPKQAVQACDKIAQALSGSTYLLEWRHECASYFLELGHVLEAQRVYRGILTDAPDDSVAKGALERLNPSYRRQESPGTK